MILPILAYGHPILRKNVNQLRKIKEIKSLISNMWETMYNAEGVGLPLHRLELIKKFYN